jgi:hypothetical protein
LPVANCHLLIAKFSKIVVVPPFGAAVTMTQQAQQINQTLVFSASTNLSDIFRHAMVLSAIFCVYLFPNVFQSRQISPIILVSGGFSRSGGIEAMTAISNHEQRSHHDGDL